MKRIANVIEEAMGKYMTGADGREAPSAGLHFLEGLEAAWIMRSETSQGTRFLESSKNTLPSWPNTFWKRYGLLRTCFFVVESTHLRVSYLPFLSLRPPIGLHSLLNVVILKRNDRWYEEIYVGDILQIDLKCEYAISELKKAQSELANWKGSFNTVNAEAKAKVARLECKVKAIPR